MSPVRTSQTSSLSELLERVLDQGIILAGDLDLKSPPNEALYIQVRLLTASAQKAREGAMDWWVRHPDPQSTADLPASRSSGDSCGKTGVS
jgi:Gas vesicle protein